MKYLLLLLIISGCGFGTKTFEYELRSTDVVMFETIQQNVYKAKIEAIGYATCPLEVAIFAKANASKQEIERYGLAKKIASGPVKETIFDGDWYGGPLGVGCSTGECIDNLIVRVTYFY